MDQTPPTSESFEAFKNSFSYGSRNDLNFKFLASLSADEAADFFQGLLWKLGDLYDDGDASRLVQHAAEWQARAYGGIKSSFIYDDPPFAPLKKPVSEARLTLISSSGHFVEGDDPEPFGVKGMSQEEAMARISEFIRSAPTLSSIPVSTSAEKLRVRHGGYDIRGAQTDPNVVLPYERLKELAAEGLIGELSAEVFSFVGAAAQTPLVKETGPQWVSMLQEQQIEAALMVPA